MRAIELLTGFVTAPGAVQTNLTMAAGNTLTVRNGAPGAKVGLISAWADVQAAGILRIRSPMLHDNVQGIRFRTTPSEPDPLLPRGPMQMLQPQDTLTVDLSGSAVAGDIETASLLLYYEDLPGIAGRYIGVEELNQRLVNITTIENSLTAGVAGGYSGEEALDADFDLLHANTDYAIIGYQVNAEVDAVRYRGIDFGNLGIGGPGNDTDKWLTGEWFMHLSKWTGLDFIPVFNSANKSGTLVDIATDENGGTIIVSTIVAQLAAA